MNYKVKVAQSFKKEAKFLSKRHKSLALDIDALISELEKSPFQGQPLGKDCYKIRMAISSKGKGKSGGGRVITCVKIVANTVILLSIYDKSDKENLSEKELDELLALAGLL